MELQQKQESSLSAAAKYGVDLLMWYPFPENGSILYIGNDVSLFQPLLETKGSFTTSSLSEELNTDFDTIILDLALDGCINKKEILKFYTDKLTDEGTILLTAKNKLGINRIGIQSYLESETSSELLSLKEWESLLQPINKTYSVMVPYPTREFPEYIFGTEPRSSDIFKPIYHFDGPYLRLLNETSFIKKAVDSGYAHDFFDSFLFIIGKQLDIALVKFSRERKKEFQIFTVVAENSVCKYPVYPEGQPHIQRLLDFYQTNTLPKYCPVTKDRFGCRFPFIDGISLESKAEKISRCQNLDYIYSLLDTVKQLALETGSIPFKATEGFKKIFGNQDLAFLEGEEAVLSPNIDLILENILQNQDGLHIIDYEWTFSFPVPLRFILFRTIFHSPAISGFSSEQLDKIYDHYGITKSDWEKFLMMEESFQDCVSADKVSNINEPASFMLEPVPLEHRIKEFSVCTDGQEDKKYYFGDDPDVSFVHDISGKTEISLTGSKKMIIKINHLKVDGQEISFTTNADIQSGKDYFFQHPPKICFHNTEGKTLEFSGYVFYYNNGAVDNLISLTEANHNINQQFNELRNNFFVRILKKLRLC